jgi:hypothetical protein
VLVVAPADAVFLFFPMALGVSFEVSRLGRSGKGRQDVRKEMNRKARVKRIKPWIPFIKGNYSGFGPSNLHR